MDSKIAVIAAALCVACVTCYPSGAPAPACAKLAPIHMNSTAQSSSPPYTIDVDGNQWSTSDMLKVMLIATGNETINGFLIQARKQSDGAGLGMFDNTLLPAKTRLGPCTLPGMKELISVTHTDPTSKGDLTFMWKGTGGDNYDDEIYFQAAVAVDHDIYWTNIVSKKLAKAPSPTVTKVMPTTTDSASLPTSSLLLTLACVTLYFTK